MASVDEYVQGTAQLRVMVKCPICDAPLSVEYKGDHVTYVAVCEPCRDAVNLVRSNIAKFRALASIPIGDVSDGTCKVPL